MTAQNKLRAVKTLVRVTLNYSFRIRPRTEVSSLLIVQPAAKIQSPEPRNSRVDSRCHASHRRGHCRTLAGVTPGVTPASATALSLRPASWSDTSESVRWQWWWRVRYRERAVAVVAGAISRAARQNQAGPLMPADGGGESTDLAFGAGVLGAVRS